MDWITSNLGTPSLETVLGIPRIPPLFLGRGIGHGMHTVVTGMRRAGQVPGSWAVDTKFNHLVPTLLIAAITDTSNARVPDELIPQLCDTSV